MSKQKIISVVFSTSNSKIGCAIGYTGRKVNEMGTYEIIFERENGIIGIDFFCANSSSIALQEFEKAYRYRSGKVISCTRLN